MSAAGEFILECERRGVKIWVEKDQVCIGGPPDEVRAMEASLFELAIPTAELVMAWTNAVPPTLSRWLH